MLARRDDRGHGQLRVHARSREGRGATPRRAQPRARRGHRPEGPGRGDRLDLPDVPRVPRRRRGAAQGHRLRLQHRTFGAAHLGHGRASLRGRGHRRGPRAHERPAGGRVAGRSDRPLDVAEPASRDVGRTTRGLPAGGLGRGGGPCRRDERGGRRHSRDRGRRHGCRRAHAARRRTRADHEPRCPEPGARHLRARGDEGGGPPPRLLGRVRHSRRADHRPDPLPRDLGVVVARNPAPVRPARRVDSAARAAPRRAARDPRATPGVVRPMSTRPSGATTASGREWGRRRDPPTSRASGSTGTGCHPTPPSRKWPESAVSTPQRR